MRTVVNSPGQRPSNSARGSTHFAASDRDAEHDPGECADASRAVCGARCASQSSSHGCSARDLLGTNLCQVMGVCQIVTRRRLAFRSHGRRRRGGGPGILADARIVPPSGHLLPHQEQLVQGSCALAGVLLVEVFPSDTGSSSALPFTGTAFSFATAFSSPDLSTPTHTMIPGPSHG